MVWDPTTPPGLVAWHDATTITGQADNTLLSSWPAASGGAGYTLAQVGAGRPTYYSSTAGKIINGHPAVWFNGGQAMSESSSQGTKAQPLTILLVGKVTAVTGTQVFFDNLTSTAGVKLQMTGGNWSATAGTVLTGPAADTNLHLFALVVNGASSKLIVDGSTTSGAMGSNGEEWLNLGSTSLATNLLSGPVCEMALYSGVMSAGDLASWLSYAATKWGTPGPAAINGTASLPLGLLSLTSTGTVSGGTVTGTAALSLGSLSVAATGTILVIGTVTVPLGSLALTAAGTVLPLLTATAEIDLPPLTVTTTGTVSGPFYIFTPPVEPYVPPVPAGQDGHNDPPWRLMQFFRQEVLRGVNVFKMSDGNYFRDDRTGVWPTTPDVPNDAINWTWSGGSASSPIMTPIDNPVLFVYYGGHSYVVDQAEADRLVGAGFGENVTAVVDRRFGDGLFGDGLFGYQLLELAEV